MHVGIANAIYDGHAPRTAVLFATSLLQIRCTVSVHANKKTHFIIAPFRHDFLRIPQNGQMLSTHAPSGFLRRNRNREQSQT